MCSLSVLCCPPHLSHLYESSTVSFIHLSNNVHFNTCQRLATHEREVRDSLAHSYPLQHPRTSLTQKVDGYWLSSKQLSLFIATVCFALLLISLFFCQRYESYQSVLQLPIVYMSTSSKYCGDWVLDVKGVGMEGGRGLLPLLGHNWKGPPHPTHTHSLICLGHFMCYVASLFRSDPAAAIVNIVSCWLCGGWSSDTEA